MTGVWLGVAAAGALGAVARFVVDRALQRGVFPVGTFVINMTGSLALGVLTGLVLYHGFPSTPKIILGTGFCGAYTTFSTWTFETVRLLEDGDVREAAANLVLSLAVGGMAAGAGIALTAL